MRTGVRLGIDVGTARVGVSRSDLHGMLATPIETLERRGDVVARIRDLALEVAAIEIVIGLPLALSGRETASTSDARVVAAAVSLALDVSVRLVDERLTTVSAARALRESGRTAKNSRSVVDQVAAVILLQHALDYERSTGKPPGALVSPDEGHLAVTDNDNWDDIFRSQPAEPTATASRPEGDAAPTSRRAARERVERSIARWTGVWRPPPRRRWPWVVLGIFSLLLGIGAAGAWYVWTNYEEQVREVMGWELPNDFEGTGNGTEVLVTISSGEIGADVAQSLVDQGVTMTFTAFYDLLIADPSIQFVPGTYQLQAEMSARSALAALLDPLNKIELSATVREGLRAGEVIDALAAGTGLPLADYEAAIADPSIYGVPEIAPNIEDTYSPATYTFEPGTTAEDHIRTLVDEMFRRLDAAGVAESDRHPVLTKASLIQREARLPDDFYRVSRVIENRLAEDWLLQFDSASQYGAGETGSVWSSGDALAGDNPYNTYAIRGLPIGPIAAPGDLAIDAVLNPVDGDWLYFVTVNLVTGETVFSQTLAQHEAGVAQLRAWCRASEENAVYCA